MAVRRSAAAGYAASDKVTSIDRGMRSTGSRSRRRLRRSRREKTEGNFDYRLLLVVILLICFGLVMLYSASAYEAATDASIGDDMYYFRRQGIISAVAVVIALGLSKMDYHIFIRFSAPFYWLALGLMAAVRFTPLGVTANGSRRWLKLGPFQFQPAELAKIAIILIMPYMIMKMGRYLKTFRAQLILFLVGMVQAGAAFIFTDNLSTAVIIMAICVLVIYVSAPNSRYFWMLVAAGVAGVILLLIYASNLSSATDNFRLRRIIVWLHPEENMSSGGYQVLQGLYAIGNGGFFGTGLGNSTQKLSTIPEAQNDMIFSIICEELGLFGAIVLLILFGYLLYRLFVIAQNAPDLYGTLIAAGVFFHVSLQVILNICVVLNLIPTTGVTLPFVSYGGTSILFMMAEIGLVLSVSSRTVLHPLEEETVSGEEEAISGAGEKG